jgi:antitoxin PrlF
MITTVTSKGQVTIPKSVREAARIKPGDKVDIRNTATGGVYIVHPDRASESTRRSCAHWQSAGSFVAA